MSTNVKQIAQRSNSANNAYFAYPKLVIERLKPTSLPPAGAMSKIWSKWYNWAARTHLGPVDPPEFHTTRDGAVLQVLVKPTIENVKLLYPEGGAPRTVDELLNHAPERDEKYEAAALTTRRKRASVTRALTIEMAQQSPFAGEPDKQHIYKGICIEVDQLRLGRDLLWPTFRNDPGFWQLSNAVDILWTTHKNPTMAVMVRESAAKKRVARVAATAVTRVHEKRPAGV
jgi:hypothetical protein